MRILIILAALGWLSSCGQDQAFQLKVVEKETQRSSRSVDESDSGGGDSKSGSGSTGLDGDFDTKITLTFRQGMSFQFTVFESISAESAEVSGLPSWMNYSDGRISGTLPLFADTGATSAEIMGTQGAKTERVALEFVVLGDPLAQHAWHLLNVGQNTFSNQSGATGSDIRSEEVYEMGFTGEGVRIAVSDVAAEVSHEDLVDNVLSGESRDYSSSPPYGEAGVPSHMHGTGVAGLIAASGWNGLGSRGIAPNAKFASFNFIDSSGSSEFTLDQATGDFDIFNASWGLPYVVNTTQGDPLFREKLREGTNSQRDGKGSIYVKAAGNEFYLCQLFDPENAFCSQNASADPQNTVPYQILVGALNALDSKASYSTAGSALWISAPGGETGEDSPAMVTTDLEGCSRGSAISNAEGNPFESNSNGLNGNCNYTSAFNGTSSAAPVVSGVIALILEANPRLGWRDVKRILAKTARKVDPNFSSLVIGGTSFVFEPGWLTNAAGYNFHNFYGFGAIDAASAVKMAQSYSEYLPTVKETRSSFDTETWSITSGTLSGASIPDNSTVGVSHSIDVSTDYLIESMEFKINLSHTYVGDLSIEVTSPAGTKNVILNPMNNFVAAPDLTHQVFLSNAFYGERSQGSWTIKVIDVAAEDTGTLTDWSINVIGD